MKNGIGNFLAIAFSVACLLLYPVYLIMQQIVPEVVNRDVEIIEFAVGYANGEKELSDVPKNYEARANGNNLIIVGNGEVISFYEGQLISWDGEDIRISNRSFTVVFLAAVIALFLSTWITIPLSKRINL